MKSDTMRGHQAMTIERDIQSSVIQTIQKSLKPIKDELD